MNAAADCPNLRAFLLTIRRCEGTDADDGYRYLFGSTKAHPKLFASYAEHPKVYTAFHQTDGLINYTTAAGAYQMIWPTWERLRDKLHLPDFSPESQDRAAIELIRERRAYDDVCAGRWQAAVAKCAGEWASLPGGSYPQLARSWDYVRAAYAEAGGTFEALA